MDDHGSDASIIIDSAARIAEIPAADWDRLANPDPSRYDPFVSHAFLAALEASGSVGPGTGWTPLHLVARRDGDVVGVMPLYVKGHSQGEYVFDHAWAEALHRAGSRYYPKLQCAVPFTPVPGRRLLVGAGDEGHAIATALVARAIGLAEGNGLSSFHITFPTEQEWQRAGDFGMLQRTGQQFHWSNAGYGSFEDFLGSLASRKRKAVRKERSEALSQGLVVERVSGAQITEAHWDSFFHFYLDTGARKWGRPYLNRQFFSLLGAALGDRCLLIFAKSGDRYVAGAMHLLGGDCLYGRYWGAIEHHPFLHFELCYYQAIEIAIERGLARAEAGAQGEHKLARGYLPQTTYSMHWIGDPRLREGVRRYLEAERTEVAAVQEELTALGPYRRSDTGEPEA